MMSVVLHLVTQDNLPETEIRRQCEKCGANASEICFTDCVIIYASPPKGHPHYIRCDQVEDK